MRLAAAILLTLCAATAQFRSTVPLVIAPTTVTDSKGHYVDGLTESDLILYDNNVPQAAQMDWMEYPISLVVAVQTSDNSGDVLDKLGGSGILFAQLVAGDRGETAVLSFSDQVHVRQDFTSKPESIIKSLKTLHVDGGSAVALDALRTALRMLEARQPGRRRIVLMISEKRDRGSQAKLTDVVQAVEQQNAAVYWLTYSPFLMPFTQRPKKVKDVEPPEQVGIDKKKDEEAVPPELGPGGLVYALSELFHMSKPDIAELMSKATGARTAGFLRKRALEETIQAIGEEIHRQYILSFQPKPGAEGQFHNLRVVVKNRQNLQVRTRPGYWSAQ